jgi:hypothetical protein
MRLAYQEITMQSALRTETTILPGHRLEITAPELPEGARVEVIVVLPEKAKPQFGSALEFLESLPAGPRAFSTWEEYERHLREEKDSWER